MNGELNKTIEFYNVLATGIAFESMVEEHTEGPGSFMIIDPDGNPILVDQHR